MAATHMANVLVIGTILFVLHIQCLQNG